MPRLLLPFLALLLLASCNSDDDAALVATSRQIFGTIPAAPPADARLVALGRHLYFSPALSANGTQSCDSCHPVNRAGVDGKPTSPGALGTRGRRNSPTTFNAVHHLAQFWDGRAATLEEQAAGPITNPAEMAMPDAHAVAQRLRNSPAIDRQLFRAAFPGEADPLTLANAARAIAAFEGTLRTEDRFDRFQSGQIDALSRQEREGLRAFVETGCASCHNGPLLGANKYMKMGLIRPYENKADRGRYEVTKSFGDDYVFKVPSLRNVSSTAPYFHDGRIASLPAAVDRMAWHQLGKKLETPKRDAIVAFLAALSDEGRASRRP
jgi:cytochrome c peroxidase